MYNVIATGSDGNATIIHDDILVDCGVPFRALRPYVKRLQLVLLTHEHGDHFNPGTVRRLAHDRPALRWGACAWMVQHLLDAGVDRRRIDVLEPDHLTVYGNGLCVSPFRLTHNVENCGYKIYTGGKSFLYATDTGTMDGITAKGFDFYLLEANHRREELEARAAEKLASGLFSYELKAAENHLSYEQARDWLAENMGPKSVWIPMHGHREKHPKFVNEV